MRWHDVLLPLQVAVCLGYTTKTSAKNRPKQAVLGIKVHQAPRPSGIPVLATPTTPSLDLVACWKLFDSCPAGRDSRASRRCSTTSCRPSVGHAALGSDTRFSLASTMTTPCCPKRQKLQPCYSPRFLALHPMPPSHCFPVLRCIDTAGLQSKQFSLVRCAPSTKPINTAAPRLPPSRKPIPCRNCRCYPLTSYYTFLFFGQPNSPCHPSILCSGRWQPTMADLAACRRLLRPASSYSLAASHVD